MGKSILVAILLIALTDVALQLDNALAISSVASGVPPGQRLLVLAVGVLLAACCLFLFTLIGSNLVDRITWLKPVAGVALVVIGGQLILNWIRQ
jgi:predicted tellurium resistance membrane protein TerC